MRQFLISITVLITAAHAYADQAITVEELFQRIDEARVLAAPYDIELTTDRYQVLDHEHRARDLTVTTRIRRDHEKVRNKLIISISPLDLDPKDLPIVDTVDRLYRDGFYKRLSTDDDGEMRAGISDPYENQLPEIGWGLTNNYTHIEEVLTGRYREHAKCTLLQDGTIQLTTKLGDSPRYDADDQRSRRYIIDPAKSYLILQAESLDASFKPEWRYTTTETTEVRPGVWLPTKFEREYFYPGYSGTQSEGTITVHSIDEPIDDSVFALDIPKGVEVVDENSIVYVCGNDPIFDARGSRINFEFWVPLGLLAAVFIIAKYGNFDKSENEDE